MNLSMYIILNIVFLFFFFFWLTERPTLAREWRWEIIYCMLRYSLSTRCMCIGLVNASKGHAHFLNNGCCDILSFVSNRLNPFSWSWVLVINVVYTIIFCMNEWAYSCSLKRIKPVTHCMVKFTFSLILDGMSSL